MSNSIARTQQYLQLMDEVYKANSRTAILEPNGDKVKFKGGNKVELFKTSINGFADYNRSTGFVAGSVTSTWEELALTKDRGISLSIDRMDNEEAIDMPMATTLSEFIRTQEVPEIDAYRFATIAGTSSIQSASADITVGSTDVPALIEAGELALDNEEVPAEDRVLFVSPTAYAGLKAKITRSLANERGVNKEVETFNDMPVIRVPQGRFWSAITLYDGTSNFGFAPTSGAYKLNFVIVHKAAVLPVVKHNLTRIFNPDENQTADAWKIDVRTYHDCFVEANKVKGVYVHKKATAN